MLPPTPRRGKKPIRESGGSQYTFHLEACSAEGSSDAPTLCSAIREAGMRVGVALKPGTPASDVAPFVSLVDMVLVMTVEPGFGGQSFMPNMMPKVLELRAAHPELDIEVDGGLGPSTVDAAAKAGANMIVAGSSVFKPGSDQRETINRLRRSVEEHGHGAKVA
mmetsp:Transcript_92389/g.261283  ORF Transcript_92389/g.261283 Transcript_92389/m.261283 type:complete len:164 (-) Transcript_92389:26-517(-)